MSCCTNSLKLGCYKKCDVIELEDFDYDATGIHTHEYKVSYFENPIKHDVTDGDPIRIDATLLNESAEHTLRIRKPDGTYYVFVKDDVEYDCIEFKIEL